MGVHRAPGAMGGKPGEVVGDLLGQNPSTCADPLGSAREAGCREMRHFAIVARLRTKAPRREPLSSDAASGPDWSLGRRLAAEFVVIVVGVLVALGVDAAREARQERVREAAYLGQLESDLAATAEALAEAIAEDELALENAQRAAGGLASARLPNADSLRSWVAGATNGSSFHPTMGTIRALVEGGELRLLRDAGVRRGLLEYHGSVEGALRIYDAVDAYMWRTVERLGGMLSWAALLEPDQAPRLVNDWASLSENRAFHGVLYDLHLSASNRLFALRTLGASLESLREVLRRQGR